jgi:hypothetical protein
MSLQTGYEQGRLYASEQDFRDRSRVWFTGESLDDLRLERLLALGESPAFEAIWRAARLFTGV